jgi:hypothetical protein
MGACCRCGAVETVSHLHRGPTESRHKVKELLAEIFYQLTFANSLSGLSNKFLYVLIMSLQFGPSIALGEGPVHGFAVEIASVSPRQHFVT